MHVSGGQPEASVVLSLEAKKSLPIPRIELRRQSFS